MKWSATLFGLALGCGSRVDDGPPPPRTLGVQECRAQGRTCPTGCEPVFGVRIDNVKQCMEWDALLTCSTQPKPPVDNGCFVSEITGEVYLTSRDWGLSPPNYNGFRRCSAEEERAYDSVRWAGNPRCEPTSAP